MFTKWFEKIANIQAEAVAGKMKEQHEAGYHVAYVDALGKKTKYHPKHHEKHVKKLSVLIDSRESK
jgi:hypothetical protein